MSDMNYQLDRNIKDIIDEFSEVGDILEKAGIACTTCGVGTCKLRDIIEIHNITEEQERELLLKIREVIYPGQTGELPKIERKVKAEGELQYSPPIKGLVEEHVVIKGLLRLIPTIVEKLDVESDEDLIKEIVSFIKEYADKYHHAKEEDILFKCFDEDLDIIKVMLEDHDTGRNHVKKILSALEEKDVDTIKKHLVEYKELLDEHIKKEDEVLYPWLDRNLSDKQVGELFSKFSEVNIELKDISEKNKKFIEKLKLKCEG
ncbi:MAG: hemerythrin domain-containing protein [Candidatus Woesearchaeota archaeon]|jgi:hemerythrin-like domain-containing protein|nr:hemerythrin domain-containing protein [Candidatus Woesearchaeota archaeon]|tara:strand:+ start:232 stop:1014 length:783 start_codon:yes stop_codon:yes gene_type:complete